MKQFITQVLTDGSGKLSSKRLLAVIFSVLFLTVSIVEWSEGQKSLGDFPRYLAILAAAAVAFVGLEGMFKGADLKLDEETLAKLKEIARNAELASKGTLKALAGQSELSEFIKSLPAQTKEKVKEALSEEIKKS